MMNICIQLMEEVNTKKVKKQENQLEIVATVSTTEKQNIERLNEVWEACWRWQNWEIRNDASQKEEGVKFIWDGRRELAFPVLDFHEKWFTSPSLTFTSSTLEEWSPLSCLYLQSIIPQPHRSSTHFPPWDLPICQLGCSCRSCNLLEKDLSATGMGLARSVVRVLKTIRLLNLKPCPPTLILSVEKTEASVAETCCRLVGSI